MKRCLTCDRVFDEGLKFCPHDGGTLVSSILDGKYQLEEKIGEGGMGQVFRATHIHIDTTVAVKLLSRQIVSSANAIDRFRREAKTAARIKHPNAVGVSDFGVTADGTVYLVMEFLVGQDLRHRLHEQKALSYEATATILFQICAAVNAAHAKGVIHRDLKPDNIYLIKTPEGSEQVKVLDFGLAKLKDSESDQLTKMGSIMGTPYYMSPEQGQGLDLDFRGDVYSLGVILYEMLTGQVPFTGNNTAVIYQHCHEPPPPPSKFRPNMPPIVEQVILKALAKNRDERYDSAGKLYEEFDAALRASGVPLTFVSQVFASPLYPQNRPSYGTYGTDTSFSPDTTGVNTPNTATPRTNVPTDNRSLSASITGGPSGGAQTPAGVTATSVPPRVPTGSETGKKSNIVVIALAAVVALLVLGIGGAGVAYLMMRPGPSKPIVDNPPPTTAVPAGMAFVPEGTFTMGDDRSEDPGSKPEHSVKVKAFYLDQYEVTNEQYLQFVKSENHPAPGGWKDGTFPSGEAKFPVTNITWQDAVDFAKWAGKRLPTEAEWEYAARGTDKRIFPWGNDFTTRNANTEETSKESGRSRPLPVGSYPQGKSPFGVFDLCGNVAEWTVSKFDPYPESSAVPKEGRVIRGGSYERDKRFAYTYGRAVLPETKTFPSVGFRCAKDVTP
jgi:eukaryotic-like serine/threonine-protein kinase